MSNINIFKNSLPACETVETHQARFDIRSKLRDTASHNDIARPVGKDAFKKEREWKKIRKRAMKHFCPFNAVTFAGAPVGGEAFTIATLIGNCVL